jgi:hypothetical protein
MGTPADPEGSSESSLLARLVEDVANLREALSVSRIREDCLLDQVSTLEAMVATLWDSAHRPSVVATHRESKKVKNKEHLNDEEEDLIDDVKSLGDRRKKTQRGRVPNR